MLRSGAAQKREQLLRALEYNTGRREARARARVVHISRNQNPNPDVGTGSNRRGDGLKWRRPNLRIGDHWDPI
jgi:hypothetical protein